MRVNVHATDLLRMVDDGTMSRLSEEVVIAEGSRPIKVFLKAGKPFIQIRNVQPGKDILLEITHIDH